MALAPEELVRDLRGIPHLLYRRQTMPIRSSLLLSAAALSLAGSIAVARAEGPAQTFIVEVTNVSTAETLRLPDGKTINVPVAPGAYAVVTRAGVLFQVDRPAGNLGLEALAEDGNAQPLIAALAKQPGVRSAGLLVPGQPLEISAIPGDRLVFAAMFVQSNDLFYAPGMEGIALFQDDGRPINGDLTSKIRIWDAGTEVNQAPGAGGDQAPRQKAPNTGAAENGVVHVVNDGFDYPPVEAVLRVTVTPN